MRSAAPAEVPTWARLLAAVELCAVILPLSILGVYALPLGIATSVASLQRGGGLPSLLNLGWSTCALAGLCTAWQVLTRLAWSDAGSLRLNRLQLVGLVCGVVAGLPFVGVQPSWFSFLSIPPVSAAALGIVHLLLHVVEGRRLSPSA